MLTAAAKELTHIGPRKEIWFHLLVMFTASLILYKFAFLLIITLDHCGWLRAVSLLFGKVPESNQCRLE